MTQLSKHDADLQSHPFLFLAYLPASFSSVQVHMWEHITEIMQDLRPDLESAAVDSEEELIEYEGMLISAAAASRRRWASSSSLYGYKDPPA